MFRSFSMGCVAAALIGLVIGCDGGSSGSSNLSTPKAAATSFMQAMQRGDASAAKAAAVSNPETDKAIEGMAMIMGAASRMRAAAEERFGKEQGGFFGGMDMGQAIADIDTATETITGDTATLTATGSGETLKFRRVSGQWKVEFNSRDFGDDLNIDQARQISNAMNELASEIKAGKYKTAQEAQMALGMKMMPGGAQ